MGLYEALRSHRMDMNQLNTGNKQNSLKRDEMDISPSFCEATNIVQTILNQWQWDVDRLKRKKEPEVANTMP